jgi:hypothetical protein
LHVYTQTDLHHLFVWWTNSILYLDFHKNILHPNIFSSKTFCIYLITFFQLTKTLLCLHIHIHTYTITFCFKHGTLINTCLYLLLSLDTGNTDQTGKKWRFCNITPKYLSCHQLASHAISFVVSISIKY